MSVQNVLPVKASCPLAKNVHDTLEINNLTLYPGVGENGFQKLHKNKSIYLHCLFKAYLLTRLVLHG